MTNRNEAGWKLEQSYQQLPALFYTETNPTAVQAPKLIVLNKGLAKQLGLDVAFLESKQGEEILAGNTIPEGSLPLAQAYAGHQFGNFTRLGDGRAILLGEQTTPTGEKVDVQLKGAGKTPYSRGGDGRAGLGPMLREYIISEAMHALGIPTTRGLAVTSAGESIIRETLLEGAVLTRIAASHLRVGTFQYATAWGTREDLEALANYTIEKHDKEAAQREDPYLHLLENVIERQAKLIAQWQLVGFIHGVMNTDNMTISGETIDYGPCAFMDTYDRYTVFSSIDRQGRYAYGNQPTIGQWNLTQFAITLLPLLHDEEEQAVELAQDALAKYDSLYEYYYITGMREKLGLHGEQDEDEGLIDDLLSMMQRYEADYTNTFIALTFGTIGETPMGKKEDFAEWHKRWENRRKSQDRSETESQQMMRASNPAVIPRNHRVEEALAAAVEDDDYSVMNELLHLLSTPFAHTKEQAEYAHVPPPQTAYQTFCGT